MKLITRKEAREFGLKRYFTGKACKNGHTSERKVSNGCCVECSYITDAKSREKIKDKIKERRSDYVDKNREKINKAKMDWYMRNRDRELSKRRKYEKENKERISKKDREYRIRNSDRIRESRRSYYREYMRKRRLDPEFKMKMRIRDMLRRIRCKTGSTKLSRSEIECGYSSLDLVRRMEKLWVDGMSWENYGEWHIDHIESIKSMISRGVTDPKIINALSNLQPLWAEENLKKGA